MKSKIKLTDLSAEILKPKIKMLSDGETIKVVGGCPRCPNPTPGGPYIVSGYKSKSSN